MVTNMAPLRPINLPKKPAEIAPNQGNVNTPPPKGTSTATIVVLSLLGIAVVGTIIYFVARPKK